MDYEVSLTQNEERYIEFDSGAGEICPTPMLIEYLKTTNKRGEFVSYLRVENNRIFKNKKFGKNDS